MTKNVSDSLARALSAGPPDQQVPLHLMFHREPSDEQWQQAVEQLRSLLPECKVELLSRSRMALVQAPLDRVPAIAEIPGVSWIDADKTAPPKSLLDAPG